MTHRPRRLRGLPALRNALRRVTLRRSDFILPVFVCHGSGVRQPVRSMPGVEQMSVDVAVEYLAARRREGFIAYIAFGVIPREAKDDAGSPALDPDNVVCRLLRAQKSAGIDMTAITDLCFCEYTSHGHCGILAGDASTVRNDPTVSRLVTQAVNHAAAGADIVAPSGMMDGTVAALRAGLDAAGHDHVAILAYAVKYASAFYGPFRDAADSAPSFGDRQAYQMDPARGTQEAITEALGDEAQGADMIMVKPALPYLDVLAAVRSAVRTPVVAYQVSGELAMIEAAAANGWIDGDRVALESLTAIKRAGADLIITYLAPRITRLIPA